MICNNNTIITTIINNKHIINIIIMHCINTRILFHIHKTIIIAYYNDYDEPELQPYEIHPTNAHFINSSYNNKPHKYNQSNAATYQYNNNKPHQTQRHASPNDINPQRYASPIDIKPQPYQPQRNDIKLGLVKDEQRYEPQYNDKKPQYNDFKPTSNNNNKTKQLQPLPFNNEQQQQQPINNTLNKNNKQNIKINIKQTKNKNKNINKTQNANSHKNNIKFYALRKELKFGEGKMEKVQIQIHNKPFEELNEPKQLQPIQLNRILYKNKNHIQKNKNKNKIKYILKQNKNKYKTKQQTIIKAKQNRKIIIEPISNAPQPITVAIPLKEKEKEK